MSVIVKFNSTEVHPEEAFEERSFLIVNQDRDYLVGKPLFDADRRFLCFMTSAGPVHQSEYVTWALLPTL
ncbi:hypothetical protein DSF51_20275 [Salmonella enterica subsp. enterica serovar Sarajane]|nr:hypothetical protein [Salmonella enterica]EBS1117276.1 hypothetical protein [Salmonella enterica subsp. enterica serovar Poona]EBW5467452.1 hypothetical protein [Salmonella enterica subsp. enterica serovar Urbana]EBX5008360.1 hypothetical protein [Salmonella enterica subsp. enterica serovar Sarajane]EAO9572668.1 hypothetical protein [Salmonella enterica]